MVGEIGIFIFFRFYAVYMFTNFRIRTILLKSFFHFQIKNSINFRINQSGAKSGMSSPLIEKTLSVRLRFLMNKKVTRNWSTIFLNFNGAKFVFFEIDFSASNCLQKEDLKMLLLFEIRIQISNSYFRVFCHNDAKH